MRYLTRPFAVAALRRGRQVEQFIGPIGVSDDVRAVRWVAVWQGRQGYEVWSYDVEDLDDEQFRDLTEFPPVGADSDEEPAELLIGHSEDPDDALRLAEDLVGASPGRWVNQGVAGEDYADFVRARRKGRP